MRIKTLTAIIIATLLVITVNAQRAVERFCKITVTQDKHMVEKNEVDYGPDENFKVFKDTLLISNLKKVTLVNSEIEAFNYMGSIGWDCVNIVSVMSQHNPIPYDKFVCIFKKAFSKNELQ